jgi:hypothetical protein
MVQALLALAPVLAKVLSWLTDYFGPQGQLERLRLRLAEFQARQAAEAARLEAEYRRIEKEPLPPRADLLAKMRERFPLERKPRSEK